MVGDGEVTLLQLAGRIILQAVEADAMRDRERAVRRELEASQLQLRRIYGAMACGVIAFSVDDGAVLEINDAALAILGTDRDTVTRLGMRGLWNSTTTPDGKALDPATTAQYAPALQSGQSWRDGEVLFTRPDGDLRWVRVDTVPLFDADGHLQQAVTSFVDITDHRLADQRLREGQERFRALLENALDLISIVDREGRYRYASPSYKTVLGYDPEALIDTPMFDTMEAAAAARLRERWPTMLANAATTRGAARIRHADGSWLLLDGYAQVALDNPAIDGVIYNARVVGAADPPV